MERSLVLFKPDAVQRGLVGTLLARFEAKGLKLIGMKMRTFPASLLEKHYAVHKERPFFGGLVQFMSSGPVVAMAFEGLDAIAVIRSMVGKTNSREAAPGTIRGDFGMSFSNNLVHASDGVDTAKFELGLWFADQAEISDWSPVAEPWVYNVEEELGRSRRSGRLKHLGRKPRHLDGAMPSSVASVPRPYRVYRTASVTYPHLDHPADFVARVIKVGISD